jgi:hypothetical protein
MVGQNVAIKRPRLKMLIPVTKEMVWKKRRDSGESVQHTGTAHTKEDLHTEECPMRTVRYRGIIADSLAAARLSGAARDGTSTAQTPKTTDTRGTEP